MHTLGHAFTMVPTTDLETTVAAYVSSGLTKLWQPDEDTILLGVRDRAVVMVEDDATERGLGCGPVLLVDDLSALRPAAPDEWAIAPMPVPVGRYGAARRQGTLIRYLDLSSCAEADRGWFTA